MIEASVDCVITIDAQSTILEFNAAAERTFGYRRDDVIGRPLTETIIPPALREAHRKGMAALQHGGSGKLLGRRVEMPAMRSDGSEFPVELTITRIATESFPLYTAYLRDITERKRADEKLRTSETRFREMAENIDEVFWIWTANLGSARLLYVSPAYATIWGRSCESLYSSPQSWQEALHPEDKEPVLAAIAGLDLEKKSELTYRIVRPDQSIRWISDRIFPVRDDSGVVARFAGIARDITESKLTEIALESAEGQYRSIFNNAVDGIFRTSPEGKFLVANPAAARIFGFASPEELIEERNDIARQGYVDPARREEFKRLIQEQGIVNGFEYEAYRKDGSHVWISENTRAVHGPNGEVLFFEGVLEDVTDRKRAEKTVGEQALRYKTLIETSTDSIYVVAENGDLREANAAFLRRRGYPAAEAKGLHVADWDAQWSREELQSRLRNLAGKSAVFETRHRCKDGSIFDVEVCATGVRIGEEQLIICVTRDISERKQAEHKMRAQLDELRRWQEVTLGREDRVLELKREVNQLSQRLGEPARYASQPQP